MNPETLDRLRKPFPQAVVEEVSKGPNKPSFSNVKPHHYINRLLEVAPDYTFSIKEVIVPADGKTVAVVGALVIDDVVHANIGTAQMLGEDSFKSAASDCLKRCCMMFGMGLDMYGELVNEETGEITPRMRAGSAPQQPQQPRQVQFQAPRTPVAPQRQQPASNGGVPQMRDPDGPPSEAQKNWVLKLLEKVPSDLLGNYWLGMTGMDYSYIEQGSWEGVTKLQVSNMISYLKDMGNEEEWAYDEDGLPQVVVPF